MLPKRKFIKKRHRRPEDTQENNNLQPTSLIQKLRSVDNNMVEEALAFVSSMCVLPPAPEDIVLIVELFSILHKGPNSAIYGCLYALANLIQVQPKIVPKLFELGLHKALVQLNSNDKDLLKPIIELMTVLHSYLPQQFRYLQKGVQQSLNVDHLSSHSKVQVLEFLMRAQSGSLKEDMYQKIYDLFKNQQKLYIRSLCGSILLQNSIVRQRISKQLLDFCDELIGDIDLQKQYKTNIVGSKTVEKQKQSQTDMMQQEQEVLPVEDTNYHTFNDAVVAVQTYLQAILILFEEASGEDIEQQQIEEQNQIEPNLVEEKTEISQGLSLAFIEYFTNKPINISKNTLLTFIEGQNIVHLSLRLLAYCTMIPKEHSTIIVLKCLQNSITVSPPQEILQQILLVGLHLLMKSQLPNEARGFLLTIAQNCLKIKETYKDIWICLLQIFSTQFNPEKNPVTPSQNERVGLILKNLLINIPSLTLQEWRAQTIDTIFDVFSNQQFDTYLVHLGLLPLLQEVLVRASNEKKKRFIRQVLTDIKRFLEYKRKRIHF